MARKLTRALRKRIGEVHQGLDLGFSDYYEGENVRDLTLFDHLSAVEEAEAMLGLDEAMSFSLWQELGPEHPSAEIYVLDFPSDLRAAFDRLLGGYYRQSMLCLRNWLEMRLLGIYFGCINRIAQPTGRGNAATL